MSIEDFDFDVPVGDVADLISYLNPADGTHVYTIRYAGPDMTRGDDPKKCMSIVYQKLGTVELSNPEDVDSPVGSVIKEPFTGNKTGYEVLKLRLSQIYGKEQMAKAATEKKTFKDLLLQLNNVGKNEFYVQLVTKIMSTVSKKDKKTVYDNVRILDLQLVPKDDVDIPEGFEFLEYEPAVEEMEMGM